MENASVVVSVEDYGPGIPKEEWECVFEKFYCGEGASREGIGLGLAICKGIVEAHGGKIWISIPSHEGTVFSFSLPCQPEDE
jgi:two-component system sensor histidine kinase KdpD